MMAEGGDRRGFTDADVGVYKYNILPYVTPPGDVT